MAVGDSIYLLIAAFIIIVVSIAFDPIIESYILSSIKLSSGAVESLLWVMYDIHAITIIFVLFGILIGYLGTKD